VDVFFQFQGGEKPKKPSPFLNDTRCEFIKYLGFHPILPLVHGKIIKTSFAYVVND